jgi:hypothetical protein
MSDGIYTVWLTFEDEPTDVAISLDARAFLEALDRLAPTDS